MAYNIIFAILAIIGAMTVSFLAVFLAIVFWSLWKVQRDIANMPINLYDDEEDEEDEVFDILNLIELQEDKGHG